MLLLSLALAAPTYADLQLPREGLDPLRVRVRWEATAPPDARPVIVWSHGVGGSHEAYRPLIEAWVAAGYVVAQPDHDDSLLGLSKREKLQLVRHPPEGIWIQRPRDIALVLDALPTADGLPALDLDHIGVGGHSFGAHTAMLVAGAATSMNLADPRPEAFLWLSPTGISDSAVEGGLLEGSLAPVDRPVLMITGTNDVAAMRKQPAAWRLTSWTAIDAPATLWFVDGANHGFGGITGQLPKGAPADPALVGWVAEATTQWWQHTLRDAPPGPWLANDTAQAASKGRVKVSHK